MSRVSVVASQGPLTHNGRMISGFGKRLERVLKDQNVTYTDLGHRLGLSRAAVSQWINGTTMPETARLQEIATLLGVSIDWLLTGGGFSHRPGSDKHIIVTDIYRIPILDFESAANWFTISDRKTHEGVVDFVWTDIDISEGAFALNIVGESMCDRKSPSPEDFFEGDKVLIDTKVKPNPGDFVVVRFPDNPTATFRKYRPHNRNDNGQMFDLVPLNPDWPTIYVNEDNPAEIIGTMIEHRRYRQRG